MAKDDNPHSGGGSHLSTTADVFSTRIQRRKKEHAELEDARQQVENERHAQMLEVMANIRRSLMDVVRIELGDDFFFGLDVDDFDGWPRLTIQLKSSLGDSGDYPTLQISANDRHGLGTVQIFDGANQTTSRLSIQEPGASKKLPSILRKMCRNYLDKVTEFILELEKKERQSLSALDSQISLPEVTAETLGNRKRLLIDADFSGDDTTVRSDFEQLAALDEVELLSVTDYDRSGNSANERSKPKK